MKIELKLGGHPADAFGRLLAVKAEIAEAEKQLKDRLLELEKDGVVEGAIFRVSISRIAASSYLDPKKVKEVLSDAVYSTCLSLKAPSLRFAAKARVASARISDVA